MLKSKLFYVVLLLAGCFACDQSGYKTSESGVKYKFLVEGDGAVPANKDFVYINVSFKDANDSLIFSRDDIPLQKDSALWGSANGSLEEILNLCKVGDSIEAKVMANDLYAKTFNTPVPTEIDSGSLISINLELAKVVSEADFRQEQIAAQKAQVEEYHRQNLEANQEVMKTDGEIIDAYLAKNNLQAQTTANGIRYIIVEQGEGPQPNVGDVVKVNYTGKVLEGDYFDTSIEEDAKNHDLPARPGGYAPFEFPLGMGQVIHGWDEGIALLSKGAKAKLLIPSPMAYGAQQRSPVIVANSILEFDVELIDFSSGN